MKKHALFILLLTLFFCCCVNLVGCNNNYDDSKNELTSSEIYEKVDESVVFVLIENLEGLASGTGFFIDENGTIVTNYHVIKNGVNGVIQTRDGSIYDIDKVIGYDVGLDIAILSTSAKNSTSVVIGDSDKVKVGETVYAIGYPQSFVLGTASSTFTSGMVSMIRSIGGYTYIQSTVDITNGNSGGTLINTFGEVIGITSAGINYSDIDYMNLSIPIKRIDSIKKDVNQSLLDVTERQYPLIINYYVNEEIYTSKEISYESKAENIIPDIPGFSFIEWCSDKQLTTPFDFNTKIVENTNLYAKISKGKYSITFNNEDGSFYKIITQDYGSIITAPSIQKTGYTLDGWYLNGKKYNFSTMPAENIVLTARFIINKYTINFDSDGGNSVNKITQEYNSSLIEPIKPIKEGYTFIGWYLGENEFTFSTMPAQDIYLKAKWTINQYSISFNNEDGSLYKKITQNYASTIVAPKIEKMGYTLDGWYLNGKKYNFSTMPAENIVLTAKWKINQYDVSLSLEPYKAGYVSGGGQYDYNSSLTIKAETYLGYVFDGWYDGESKITSERVYTLSLPAKNVNYVAKWKVVEEMKNFDFSSDKSSCKITTVNNKNISSAIIPGYVTELGNSCFKDCINISSIIIPNSVTSIGDKAFFDCTNLSSIEIPNSVVSIGAHVFEDTKFYKSSENWINGALYINNCLISTNNDINTNHIIETNTRLVASQAYSDITITSITIPSSLKYVGANAFWYKDELADVYFKGNIDDWCSIIFANEKANPLSNAANLYINNVEIVNLVIPSTVKKINDYAFLGCRSLESVIFSSGVTTIGSYSFMNCTNLTRAVIGYDVNHIGKYAFCGSWLQRVGFDSYYGWFYSDYINSSRGTNIGGNIISNSSTVAEWLRSRYYSYYWKRI